MLALLKNKSNEKDKIIIDKFMKNFEKSFEDIITSFDNIQFNKNGAVIYINHIVDCRGLYGGHYEELNRRLREFLKEKNLFSEDEIVEFENGIMGSFIRIKNKI